MDTFLSQRIIILHNIFDINVIYTKLTEIVGRIYPNMMQDASIMCGLEKGE